MRIKANEIKFANVDDLKAQNKKLAAALKIGQGAARSRTLDTTQTINHVQNMIKMIENIIPKSYGNNTKIIYIEGAGVFPNSYKYVPEGTKLELTKHSTFYVLYISRDNCNKWAFNEYDYLINLDSCKQKDKIKQHIFKSALQLLAAKNNINLNSIL